MTDEFILKDTEDNRKLQKKLAEEAQLTPSVFFVFLYDRLESQLLKILVSFQGWTFVQKRTKKKSNKNRT